MKQESPQEFIQYITQDVSDVSEKLHWLSPAIFSHVKNRFPEMGREQIQAESDAFRDGQTVHYPNLDDWISNFWKGSYRVLVSSQGVLFHVNADNAGEAIDYIIDWAEENAPGLVMSREEEEEEEFLDDYVCGGNHGLYLSTHNVRIVKL